MNRALTALTIFIGVMWMSPIEVASSAEMTQSAAGDVIHLSGSGWTTTQPFTIKDGWEIQWGSSKRIQVSVYKSRNTIIEKLLLVNSPTGGSGKSFHPNPGHYYLDIRSFGDWVITIVERPQEAN